MKMKALFVWRAENPLSFNGQRPREDGGTDLFFSTKNPPEKKRVLPSIRWAQKEQL